MPSCCAISSCLNPSTSCITNTWRAPLGSRAIAVSKSIPSSGVPGPPAGPSKNLPPFFKLPPLTPPPLTPAPPPPPQTPAPPQPVHPGPEGRLAAERAQLFPGADEYVLGHLVGRIRVDHATRQAVNAGHVVPVEAFISVPITASRERCIYDVRVRPHRLDLVVQRGHSKPRISHALNWIVPMPGGLEFKDTWHPTPGTYAALRKFIY